MRRIRRALLALAGAGLAACIAGVTPAAAALNGPDTPPPKGCDPVLISQVQPSAVELCVHRVLVTETTAKQEQNDSRFTVTDHAGTLTATVPNWWPSGGPTAGMVITIWGKLVNGVFQVHRWLELTHGSGPSPNGPYADVRLIDATSGKVPEHRMVWVRATAFLIDPQDNVKGSVAGGSDPLPGGDGDIHVQTSSPCPSAGLTTETTPPIRGYVDHPGAVADSTDDTDLAHNHVGEAPPAGVPVIVFGATRYDYGFGWWEIHPIRAWRFLTQAEAAQNAADCAADPNPQPDKGPNGIPVPFGFPPCASDNSEGLQSVPGYGICKPQCYVAHTAIDQPEQLASDGGTACNGIRPIVTRSLEQAHETTPGSTGISATHSPHTTSQGSSGSSVQQTRTALLTQLARVYGHRCRKLRRIHGRRSRAYRLCLLAMARLGGGETRSARSACRQQSRRTTRRRKVSDFALCVAAGKGLVRQRFVEKD
ncbi:MAG: hypothetical protein QOD76_632 [Solirubrobacteraceae bacterium]|jgi:hypothetical protein|nr:hypothetical protein [Solirubrobacteraceae bacterium]